MSQANTDPGPAAEGPVRDRQLGILRRADLLLHRSEELDLVLQRFLELMMEAAQARAGTLYLADWERQELAFAIVRGPAGVISSLQGRRMPIDSGIAGHCATRGQAIWVPAIEHDRHWARDLADLSGYHPDNVLCLPLRAQDRVIGVVQLFDLPGEHPGSQPDIDFLSVLVNDLALKVENARLLDTLREMVARLRALLDVGLELGATLDRGRLLHLILDRVRRLVRAEAASIFERIEETGELVLCATTRTPPQGLRAILLAPGEGIAGWVAQHGQTCLVPDVSQDPRFSPKASELTGFVTRSILCTPLTVQEQVPGHDQEEVFRLRVVGVAQALNKEGGGEFTRADVEIFEGLARQAAIAMERTRLYREINDLFTSAISSLAEAMEAKDPYTRGHTRRVTAISVAIAEEMALSAEEVGKIRTAALLHDIGKIGMPDSILHKPGRPDEAEMEIIRQHPAEGERILLPLQHLREIRLGVAEHHERYDGQGYPRGLHGDDISLAGRIIAVADTLDAMTSTRPYRAALPREAAVAAIRSQAGQQFDPAVVAAFLQVWEKDATLRLPR